MEIDNLEKAGVTYFELYASCPVCFEHNINRPYTYWSHRNNNCNGHVYVGENGTFLCPICGVNSNIFNWKILCPNCENDETITSALLETGHKDISFGSIVAMCGQIVQATGLAWLQTCMENLKKI